MGDALVYAGESARNDKENEKNKWWITKGKPNILTHAYIKVVRGRQNFKDTFGVFYYLTLETGIPRVLVLVDKASLARSKSKSW